MSMKTIMLSLCLLGSTTTFAEFDGFGYDEPENNTYSKPKKTIPARQVIIKNRKTITSLQRKVDELEEKLNGITSLMEGLNATMAEMKRGSDISGNSSTVKSPDNTQLLKELGLMIDNISANYVSKDELKEALAGKTLSNNRKSKKSNSVKDTKSLAGQPTSKIYSEGVRFFVKQRYDEAEKRFVITDKKGYKPAASNYYLGEIAYYTKKYEDAIFFYKKSASLYDQASYIDVLLLHTAISLEKTGDKGQAKTFYKNIVDNYPDKKSAKIAKDKLKRLK